MAKSVPNVPSYEEFYGLDDNEILDEEFDSENKDDEIRKMIIIALSLLQEFYITHMYETEQYIGSDSFKEDLLVFNELLKENIYVLFTEFLQSVRYDLDTEYILPHNIVDSDVDFEEVISSGVNAVTDTLYVDLKNKADFYRDVAITTGVFSVHSNFRRAIKRLTNVIDYNAQYTRNRVTREYQTFVYGQDALARWRVTGINTCAWCYELESMGEMPISWFPIDHPNGGCWLEIVNPNDYSEEYKVLRSLI